jgi:hypothetical protein
MVLSEKEDFSGDERRTKARSYGSSAGFNC